MLEVPSSIISKKGGRKAGTVVKAFMTVLVYDGMIFMIVKAVMAVINVMAVMT